LAPRPPAGRDQKCDSPRALVLSPQNLPAQKRDFKQATSWCPLQANRF
jgi:hypothetical protein